MSAYITDSFIICSNFIIISCIDFLPYIPPRWFVYKCDLQLERVARPWSSRSHQIMINSLSIREYEDRGHRVFELKTLFLLDEVWTIATRGYIRPPTGIAWHYATYPESNQRTTRSRTFATCCRPLKMIADNGRKYSPLICALDVSVPKAERHNFLLEIIVFFMCDMRCAVSNYVHFF